MSDSLANSPTAAPQRLTLSSPDAFLAAVPHLLGFPPRDSIVMVGLADDGFGRESIRLAQRFDRPPSDISTDEIASLAKSAVEPMRAAGSSSVILAVFGDANPAHGGFLPSEALVEGLVDELVDSDIWVKDALYSDGASRWSYGCDNTSCCPIEGTAISDELRTMMAAEFAGAGAAMAPSRQALVDEVAVDQIRVDQVARALPSLEVPAGELEAWRDKAIGEIAALRTEPNPSPESLAHVLSGLRDIRVRDTALWELAHDDRGHANIVSALTMAVRSAPEGFVAPAATALAIQHWTRGDGARANACLDRAAADEPDYSLAQMAGTAIGRGLPPSSWTDVMQQLDRQTCRHGNDLADSAPPSAPAMPVAPPAPSLAS